MNILIIDDHELFSYSLKLVLEKHHSEYNAMTLSNTDKIEAILASNDIDIILLDINLQNESGLVIGRKIKKKHPDIPLIFLTGFDLPEYRLQAKKMNADGFLNKSMKPDDLRDALQTIIKTGSSPIESEITILTKQEKRVLVLLSKGYTQNYIASELDVSKRTINNHVQSIHEKMQVNTSIEAISEGIKLGIISLLDN